LATKAQFSAGRSGEGGRCIVKAEKGRKFIFKACGDMRRRHLLAHADQRLDSKIYFILAGRFSRRHDGSCRLPYDVAAVNWQASGLGKVNFAIFQTKRTGFQRPGGISCVDGGQSKGVRAGVGTLNRSLRMGRRGMLHASCSGSTYREAGHGSSETRFDGRVPGPGPGCPCLGGVHGALWSPGDENIWFKYDR